MQQDVPDEGRQGVTSGGSDGGLASLDGGVASAGGEVLETGESNGEAGERSSGAARGVGVETAADSAGAEGFALDPKVVGKARRGHWKRTLKEYGVVYEVSDRTVKRWVKEGKKAGDLPPLDFPGMMAEWWRRVMDRQPSARLIDLENSGATFPAGDQPAAHGGAAGDGGKVEAGGSSAAAVAGGKEKVERVAEKISAFDLGAMELGDDEEVRQASAILSANFRHLDEASRRGDADAVRRWYPLWQKASEQYRKVVKAARETYEAERRLIDRAFTEAEIAQLTEALRLGQMVMPEKVVKALDGLVETKRLRRVLRLLGPKIAAAVAIARDSEQGLFRRLQSFESAEAFVAALGEAA